MTTLPLIVADFFTMWALLYTVSAAVERFLGVSTHSVTRETALVAALLLLPIARIKGLYPALGTIPAVEFREIVQSAATAVCIFAAIGMVADSANSTFFIVTTLLTLLLSIPVFPASRYLVRGLASRCSWWGAPVLVYGGWDAALHLFNRLRSDRQRGLRPAAVLLSAEDYWHNAQEFTDQGIPVYEVRQALECAVKYKATWLLVGATERERTPTWELESDIQAELNAIPNRVLLTAGGFDWGVWDRTQMIGSASGVLLSTSRHCYYQETVKRLIDIAVTSIVGLVFSPLILGIIIAIRCTSPGPIFYSQRRVGRGGTMFSAWKFRSMVCNADRVLQQVLDSNPEMKREWNETHKLKHDPRVTWIGRLIRTTSLDELPQLWNIFRGDMSLVGPRPIVDSPTYDATYVRDYPREYATYCSVRPGLTGLWQVTCRNSGVYEMRIYWDMYYIRNWSLWLDLYIILRTVRTVLLREGGY